MSSFKELVDNYYYVDKTLAMKKDGIVRFLKIGVSFYKKHVKILSETEDIWEKLDGIMDRRCSR